MRVVGVHEGFRVVVRGGGLWAERVGDGAVMVDERVVVVIGGMDGRTGLGGGPSCECGTG